MSASPRSGDAHLTVREDDSRYSHHIYCMERWCAHIRKFDPMIPIWIMKGRNIGSEEREVRIEKEEEAEGFGGPRPLDAPPDLQLGLPPTHPVAAASPGSLPARAPERGLLLRRPPRGPDVGRRE